MRKKFATGWLVLLIISLNEQVQADDTIRTFDNPPKLISDKKAPLGIGALFLEAYQADISLIVREINPRTIDKSSNDSTKLRFRKGRYQLNFNGDSEKKFFLIPPGIYQIIEIKVPHYDLPYIVATDNTDRWRFKIDSNSLNYIGSLKIAEQRSKNAISALWLNRFATHLSELNAIQASHAQDLPLKHGVGYTDIFYEKLKGKL